MDCAWLSNLFKNRPPLDVILVIDVSESMAWENIPGSGKNALEDPANPAYCNTNNTCEPFRQVKDASAGFAADILNKPPEEEEDRLAVVTFATGWQNGDLGTTIKLDWTNNIEEAMDPVDGIPSLKVYDPGVICPFGKWGCPDGPNCPADQDSIPLSACLYYGDPDPSGNYTYYGLHCPRTMDIDVATGEHWTPWPETVSACTTSNIGGGLWVAGMQFFVEKRPGAMQVIVLLTDGAANATPALASDAGLSGNEWILPPLDPIPLIENLPLGFCPEGTWEMLDITVARGEYCQDGDVDTHHPLMDPAYDADDFARDTGKFVACNPQNPAAACDGLRGLGAVIFSVGLGNEILALDADPVLAERKPYGASLLRYLAAIGDDGDAATDPCALESDFRKSCGNYFYAAAGKDLSRIFHKIYSRFRDFQKA